MTLRSRGVADRLGVSRCSGVNCSNEVDQPNGGENVECFAVWQQIEVAAEHGQIVGLPHAVDKGHQALGLDPTSRRIVLAMRVAQSMEVNDGHHSIGRAVDQPDSVGDTRTVGDGPLVVIDERSMNEAGRLSDHRESFIDEHRQTEVLLSHIPVTIDDRTCVTRDKMGLMTRQDIAGVVKAVGAREKLDAHLHPESECLLSLAEGCDVDIGRIAADAGHELQTYRSRMVFLQWTYVFRVARSSDTSEVDRR